MTVPVVLKNVRTAAIVDSGSQVTLASKALCEAAGIEPDADRCITIHGIGDEMGMSAAVASRVPLSIGNATYLWTIVIGTIREDLILGMDFLHEVGAILDFDQGFLQIADAIVVAHFITNQHGKKSAVSPVMTNERVSIAAVCGRQIECNLPDRFGMGAQVLIEPVPVALPLFLSAHLTKFEPHIVVEIVNASERSVTLPTGTVIATARQVEISDPADGDTVRQECDKQLEPEETLATLDIELQPHLVAELLYYQGLLHCK